MTAEQIKELEELDKRAQKILDIQNVEKTFNKYLQYYALQHKEGMLEQFALDQDDVSVEEGYSEVFEGKEKVTEYYDAFVRLSQKSGILLEQQSICPVIEVAEDGKTAKMVSFSRGVKCVAPAKYQSYLSGRYYADFIRNAQGEWKIWHMHWFMTYDTRVKEGFLYTQTNNHKEWTIPEMRDVFTARANKPSTYWPVIFNPLAPADYIPEAPDPYETYDGITALKRTRYLYHIWDREKFGVKEGE